MQLAFGFGAGADIAWMRDQLRARFGDTGSISLRTPIGQLVKSSISSRTRDEVSLSAYNQLVERYPRWSDLAEAPAAEVEAVIGDVSFPDVKARYVGEMLRRIATSCADFDLTFLSCLSVERALAWLERLPGVGRKVAASTLNFSTLNMPAFVVDTHVLRVLRRYGVIPVKADTQTAFNAVMESRNSWNATDLAELHILTKRLGQTLCLYDHGCCDDCPLRQRCVSASDRRRVQAVPPTSTSMS